MFISGRASQIRGSWRYYSSRVFISGRASQIRGVHFRACFADSWVAAVLSIECVHFRDCFADLWFSFQGLLHRFLGRGGTVHRGWCSFQGVLCIFVGRVSTILVAVHFWARQPLAVLSLEEVHFRACFADSWVAESAHSVSRRYYPLIGRSPGVPLKALERLTCCLSGGNLLRVLLVCGPFLSEGLHCLSCRGLCYLLAQAQALERSYLRLRPGGYL